MPFVASYMLVVAILAALAWWMGDHRRAGGLAGILIVLPAAFFVYNIPEYGSHWMTLLWLMVPAALYYQGLIKLVPAILGEFIALPYMLYSLKLLGEPAALWWGDFFGLSMVAMVGGPLIGQLVGMAATNLNSHRGIRDIVSGATRNIEAGK